jgi:hypothetical protein
MLIEDLHWIDSVSGELLNKIIDSEAKLRLLILTTRRPEYAPPWLNRTVVTKLDLEPLPVGHIRRLIQARLGVDVPPEALARQVAEKAEGNPLFVEEIVSYLTERGIIRTAVESDTSALAEALPLSVQSLLTARVDRLALKDRALLQAASVIGRRFDQQLLGVAVGEADIDTRLATMQALDLVRRERTSGDYSFKHALVRDALYQSLLSEARTALHLKIAEEIERRSGNRLTEVAEVLAYHYRQTDRTEKAFAYLSMAGSKSLSVYSLDESASYFGAALALLDKNPDCASDDQVADLFVPYTHLLIINAQVKATIDLVERYLARIDRQGDSTRAVLIRHQYVFALLWNKRFHEAVTVQRETSSLVDRLGDSRSKAYFLTTEMLVSNIVAPKTLHEWEMLKTEAVKAASETVDAYIQIRSRFWIGLEEGTRGRLTHARDAASGLMQFGHQLNDPRSTGLGLLLSAFIALASDSYSVALEYSEQASMLGVAVADRAIANIVKASSLIMLRRIDEGLPLLEDHQRRMIAYGALHPLNINEAILGVCKILQGNISGGIRSIEEGILQREKEGAQDFADWYRLVLSEVYLQIIAGSERPRLSTLLKNLPTFLKLKLTAPSRIQVLMARVFENPHFDPDGFRRGHPHMILGLLYKANRTRALAIPHLTEARRILSQFGPSPKLARVEAALADLGQ